MCAGVCVMWWRGKWWCCGERGSERVREREAKAKAKKGNKRNSAEVSSSCKMSHFISQHEQ